MYSPFIRIILAFVSLAPVLLSLYIVSMINGYKNLYWSIRLTTARQFLFDLWNLLQTHYLLLAFVLLCVGGSWLVRKAREELSVGRIELKSVKPADSHFGPVLFGVVLPFYKIYDPSLSDLYYIGGFVLVACVFAVTMKASFHYNIIFKLVLGYRHYEVATTGEITYLLLSRQKIVNRKQVEKYVYLTDYMLINMTDKK